MQGLPGDSAEARSGDHGHSCRCDVRDVVEVKWGKGCRARGIELSSLHVATGASDMELKWRGLPKNGPIML